MLALARYAWVVLAYNVAVICWGAYVRATGSGAGCGNHWPLCNGEVLPRAPESATLIEFSHRLTSGLAVAAVVVLLAWTFRVCRPRHAARTGAVFSMFFIGAEALVGAGLVLFELVADNATMARAMFMAVHLANTFLLLGCLTLTAWSLSTGRGIAMRGNSRPLAAIVVACAALIAAAASGAVAALGDTLFPSPSLAEGIHADLSSSSHFLIRLRVLHPFLAVAAAMAVALVSARLSSVSGFGARMGRWVTALIAAQLVLGAANVLLLAPLWLQLLHLLLADAIWIAFLLVAADALGQPVPVVSVFGLQKEGRTRLRVRA